MSICSSKLPKFTEFGKKIVGVGANYNALLEAFFNGKKPTAPIIFLKPPSAYVTVGKPIRIPKICQNVNYEVELGVIIGQKGFDIPENKAMDFVGGYTCALDLTDFGTLGTSREARGPWSLAKGFDSSCPVGDFIPKNRIPEPDNLKIWLKVNNTLKQDDNTGNLIFTLPQLISYISKYMTLEPGDLIVTGTPDGYGPVSHGDKIKAGLGDVTEISFEIERL
ncbi:hypothetical protein LOTGIDRAFT_190106 [Lottia gigantea]|uniref:oxaloacetate tautomerase n=1 Tax=Lottia gigantea TaxID=225164 RepID=V4BVJ3_LOTGI|nr:hypothetical protein LOTGIDRAFT_190106 [Lottia gigantea]ESO93044.1 hypothetical protein LOTGIDRAFT_190106 [Lottia gigantea]